MLAKLGAHWRKRILSSYPAPVGGIHRKEGGREHAEGVVEVFQGRETGELKNINTCHACECSGWCSGEWGWGSGRMDGGVDRGQRFWLLSTTLSS